MSQCCPVSVNKKKSTLTSSTNDINCLIIATVTLPPSHNYQQDIRKENVDKMIATYSGVKFFSLLLAR